MENETNRIENKEWCTHEADKQVFMQEQVLIPKEELCRRRVPIQKGKQKCVGCIFGNHKSGQAMLQSKCRLLSHAQRVSIWSYQK